jgi:hypothetical protein
MNILIALATYNRPIITELCLENLQTVRSNNVSLFIYDDASTAYDSTYLLKYADEVVRFDKNQGIEHSRATALRDFVSSKEHDLIYFTDNDAIHDPGFTEAIKNINTWQQNKPQILPVSLFNSVFHNNTNNILYENDSIYIQKTMPGISQVYTRQMAETIVLVLNSSPGLDRKYGWDYIYPQILGLPCLVPKVSLVEHFARDRHEAGMHSNNSGCDTNALVDFDRDRATNPSDYLANIRGSIISKILGWS